MPGAARHAKTGFFVGIVIGGLLSLINQLIETGSAAENNIDWLKIIAGGFIGGLISGFFSLLPDILEPAKTPNHRGFFHSITWSGILIIGLFKVDENDNLEPKQKNGLFCAIFGYLSHLILDSKTPKGLGIF